MRINKVPIKQKTPNWKTLSYDMTPDISGQLTVLSDNQAIQKSIETLVLTDFLERTFNGNIWAGVYDMLFEPADLDVSIISTRIQLVIKQNEPRVVLRAVSVDSYPETNSVVLEVAYTIVGSGQQDSSKVTITQ